MDCALLPIDDIALRILRFENATLRAHQDMLNIKQGADLTLEDLHPDRATRLNCHMLEGQVRYFIGRDGAKLQGHIVIESGETQRYQLLKDHLLVEWGGIPASALSGLVGKTLDDIIDIGPYQDLVTGFTITGYEDELMQKLFIKTSVYNAGWIGDANVENRKRREAGTWPL